MREVKKAIKLVSKNFKFMIAISLVFRAKKIVKLKAVKLTALVTVEKVKLRIKDS